MVFVSFKLTIFEPCPRMSSTKTQTDVYRERNWDCSCLWIGKESCKIMMMMVMKRKKMMMKRRRKMRAMRMKMRIMIIRVVIEEILGGVMAQWLKAPGLAIAMTGFEYKEIPAYHMQCV
ncbi:hypothetical protein HELRODRAFT_160321 [Helobdella robusta]|uniref:Uncharacterized protein n=1 Tax=Helobdella robusta TaxID=6412 RepID=T1EQ35_HELRO|nr:hypothetical protein HELRODRAFT_160321 [Helobdella robusta]ESO06169.1 hypothetical protein HELRODRAFT_160321 [Helobdella robusta]